MCNLPNMQVSELKEISQSAGKRTGKSEPELVSIRLADYQLMGNTR
jgi:hypothetical protein